MERELKQLQDAIETWERDRPSEETGDDHPDSSVPAPVKPRPLGAVGAVALPEPDEDDTPSDFGNCRSSLANRQQPNRPHGCTIF
jgi:hypothetical protein